MNVWGARKTKLVLGALLRIGWQLKRQSGSHKVLSRDGWADFIFAFQDGEEIGPKMLSGSLAMADCVPKTSDAEQGANERTGGATAGARLDANRMIFVRQMI